jgi:hypothetical protein
MNAILGNGDSGSRQFPMDHAVFCAAAISSALYR